MILSVGEILTDTFGGDGAARVCAGGAPFNVAANAKLCGAMVGFVGKVGNDAEGDFLENFAKAQNFDLLEIIRDAKRKTTRAEVKTDGKGERTFRFYRDGTADYALTFDEIPLKKLDEDDILHVGSLMLSTPEGKELMHKLIHGAVENNLVLSFDVNLRRDLFGSDSEIYEAYAEILSAADILKFSIDEIKFFANTDSLAEAVSPFMKKDRLLVVTMGENGSLFVKDGASVLVPPAKVEKVADTTGAGDAFMGALLYKLDCRNWRAEGGKFFADALRFANALGAFCVQHIGAVNKF